MKTALLTLVLGTAVLALSAGLAWTEPVVAASFPNIQFDGSAASAENGNILITWAEAIGEDYHRCANLFDPQLQPLWPEPLSFESIIPTQNRLVAAPDGSFILSLWQADGLYAHKLSPDGSFPWGSIGVRVFSFYGAFLEMVPDSTGGAWFSQWHEQQDYSVVQHVDASGVRLLPEAGLLLEPVGQNALAAVLFALPDNGVVVAYRSNSGLAAKRLSASGEIFWAQLGIAPAGANNPRLNKFTQSSLALSWWDDQGLQLQRYEHGGSAVWPSPLCVFSGSAWPNERYTRLLPGTDDCVFVSAKLYYEPLRLQKVSASGQLLFGTGTELLADTFNFVSDGQGGCYAGNANGDIRLAHISTSGEQLWGIEGVPVCVNGAEQSNLNLTFSNGTLRMLWMDWREGSSGIYSQQALPDGTMLGQVNGNPLRVGEYGEILHPRVRPLQESSVLVWLQRSQPSGRYQVRMQIANPDGSMLLPPEGLSLSGNCVDDNGTAPPVVIVTPSQQIMVAWTDELEGICQAQLYSASGVSLWGPGAVTVSGIPHAAAATWLDGSFIFVARKQAANGAYRLWGQKIVNGTAAWPAEGLLLVGDDPLNPNFSVENWALSGNYLAWHRGQVWGLRFTGDGSPAAGFNPWGNQISQTLPPYDLGSFSIRPIGENLHCAWYESYLVHPSFDYWSYHFVQQVVSPQGDLLISAPGIVYAEEGDPWAISDFQVEVGAGTTGFVSGYQQFSSYRLRSYSLTGELLSDGEYNLHNQPWGFNKAYYLAGLDNGKILLLCVYLTSELDRIGYLVIDPEAQVTNPLASAVFEEVRGKIRALDISRDGEDFHMAAAMSGITNGSANRLQLQKILAASSPIPDAETLTPAPFSLSVAAPNPFRGSASFFCQAERNTELEIAVYNLRGQKVRSLYRGRIPPGKTQFAWDGRDGKARPVGSGIYFLKAKSGEHSLTRKLLKLD